MNKLGAVTSLFKQGLNCAQALLGVYGIELGLKRETALKIASAFGGGIGRMGETCGAVTGALMIIGLKHGMAKPDKKAKIKTYEFVEKFLKKFKARNNSNSIVCRELLGIDISSYRALEPDLSKVIKDKCPKYVKNAAEIIEELL